TGSRKNLPPHCAVFLLIAFVLMSLQYPSGDFMPPKFVIDTGINFAQRGGWHTVWYRKVNTCVPLDRYEKVWECMGKYVLAAIYSHILPYFPIPSHKKPPSVLLSAYAEDIGFIKKLRLSFI
ncbi:MAG: hypothetical protein IKD10_02645, partial [Lentisphaeria bacterium]|nr:hypothetical protein [Lentisphaeria bacterium]